MDRLAQTTRTDRFHRYMLPVLLLLCLVIYLRGWSGGISYYHDDSIYIITSRSLAEGRGYRIESIPGSPPQTKYPVLYPALLALLWKIDPEYPANLALFRLANTLIWLGVLALTYRFIVRFRYGSPALAAFIVALWGFSSHSTWATTMVLSEPLCTLMLVASLWFCEAALEASSTCRARWLALWSGVFVGLAYLTRSAVLFLWIAPVWSLWRAGRVRAVAAAVGALPSYIGWLAWARQVPRLPPWDLRLYYLDYTTWTLAQFARSPWALGLLGNALDMVLVSLPGQILYFHTPQLIRPEAPAFIAGVCFVGLLTTALVVWGGVALWRAGRPLLPLTLLTTLLPACIQPAGTWRYALPVGGVAIIVVAHGWQQLRVVLGRRAWLLFGATGLALMGNLWILAGNLRPPSQQPSGPNLWEYAMEWVRKNVPANEAILSDIDGVMYLQTGRQGLSDRSWMKLSRRGFLPSWAGIAGYCPNPDAQLALLRRMNIRWAIDVGEKAGPRGFGFPNILRARPQAFELIHSASPIGFHVYRMRE